ncbi:helix-turn-helix transcriptional regulator [Roseivirga pacifica]|uniref:helix-turn-helix transcriptional regulator n=1 Tax=Roseivirga pacifica TaxID=1267423 RepID=UPI003BB1B2C6
MENKSTSDRILFLLKMKGAITSAILAEELGVTKEGARQKLLKLEAEGLVQSFAKSEGVGRPITLYDLSQKGNDEFPDSHAQITVELLRSIKNLLGENALDLLISDRERQTYGRYNQAMNSAKTLKERLEKLAQLRSEEGYMAEWKEEDGTFFLTENHCPICAAATECQGFCRAELKNFRDLIGKDYQVDRIKHIVSDEQRCVYRIREKVATT